MNEKVSSQSVDNPFLKKVGNADLRNWKWVVMLGVLQIATGVIAIAVPFYATIATEVLLGIILIAAGISGLMHSFRQVFSKETVFGVGVATLYLLVGVMLLLYPYIGMLSLTVLLGGFFGAVGTVKLASVIQVMGARTKTWLAISGIAFFGLAVLIFFRLSDAAYWVPGVVVGIDLIAIGVYNISEGYTAEKWSQKTA